MKPNLDNQILIFLSCCYDNILFLICLVDLFKKFNLPAKIVEIIQNLQPAKAHFRHLLQEKLTPL